MLSQNALCSGSGGRAAAVCERATEREQVDSVADVVCLASKADFQNETAAYTHMHMKTTIDQKILFSSHHV